MTLQYLRAVLENNLGPSWTIAAVFESEIVAVNDVARTHVCKQDFDDVEETNYEVAFLDEQGQTVTITEAGTEEECCSIIQEFSSRQYEDRPENEREPLAL